MGGVDFGVVEVSVGQLRLLPENLDTAGGGDDWLVNEAMAVSGRNRFVSDMFSWGRGLLVYSVVM